MPNININRILRSLGFVIIEQEGNLIRAGHTRETMLDIVFLDEYKNVASGPYSELIKSAEQALILYDSYKDRAAYWTPDMRQELFNEISKKSNLPLDLVLSLTS